jgi:hypothetical protein
MILGSLLAMALVLAEPTPPVSIVPYSALVAKGGALPDSNMLASWMRSEWPIGPIYTLAIRLDAATAADESYLAYDDTLGTIAVVIASPREGDLLARLTCPTGAAPWVGEFEVTIPASARQAADGARFAAAKSEHYARLASQNLPGAAWFRHLADKAARGLPRARPLSGFDSGMGEVGDAMDLFTGARALAENLRLETVLAPRAEGEETIAIDSIAGIEVRPFDFAKLLVGKDPQLDPLASFVPADQHAAIFPTITGLVAVIDELDRLASPLLTMADDRAIDAKTFARIQTQLCLPLTDLGRQFGPLVIEQAAFTSSDPFLRTGSDVALLFRAREGRASLFADFWRVNAKRAGEIVEVKDAAIPHAFVRNSDRSVSSYFAQHGDVLVVSNSPHQLGVIADVIRDKRAAIASADEYKFFRDRYPFAESSSALVVLPDAAMRTWCSPKFRIADARRTLALARLVEQRAASVAAHAANPAQPLVEPIDPIYGSLAFATPIAELAITHCTPAEAEIYARFRDTYQRGFSAFFDPIAVSLDAREDRLEFDLTVLPLIVGTEFEDLMDIVGGIQLGATAGRPHDEAIAQFVVAIDKKADAIQSMGSLLDEGPGEQLTDPFAWLGDYLTLYCDDDPFLAELLAADDPSEKLEADLYRIPVALEVGIADPLRAGLFMTAMRLKLEETVPGLVIFENREHAGKKYVKFRTDSNNPMADGMDYAMYYAIDATRLLLTPNENIVKRALEPVAGTQHARPWLGGSAAFRIDRRALDLLQRLDSDGYEDAVRTRAARALPILNEWSRLFPNEDPVAVHERLFHESIVVPEAGMFVFDPTRGAMTTQNLGDLAMPKQLANPIVILPGIELIDLGLGFEHGGLRARGSIER